MPDTARPPGPLLSMWAHPDDEAYLCAGLMADGVRRGERVVCVTATRGEEGSVDEERWPRATLGAVREAELLRSLEILGVREHRWLDYHDGRVPEVPRAEGVARSVAMMEEVRPATVLTFGPDGMTGHDDHKTIGSWATEAFRLSAPPGARLYYATQTPEWVQEFVPMMNRFNVFMAPGTPPVMAREQLGIDLELSPDLLDLKMRALAAHVSQLEGLMAVFGENFRRAMRTECFSLAEER